MTISPFKLTMRRESLYEKTRSVANIFSSEDNSLVVSVGSKRSPEFLAL